MGCEGSKSSKSRKENRSQFDDNGPVIDIVLSKDNVDQPMYKLRKPKYFWYFDILGMLFAIMSTLDETKYYEWNSVVLFKHV